MTYTFEARTVPHMTTLYVKNLEIRLSLQISACRRAAADLDAERQRAGLEPVGYEDHMATSFENFLRQLEARHAPAAPGTPATDSVEARAAAIIAAGRKRRGEVSEPAEPVTPGSAKDVANQILAAGRKRRGEVP